MYDIEIIKNDLKKILSEYRYNHSLLVAEEASKLARIYNINEEKAYIAGLIHDIAKELSYDKEKYYIDKYNLSKTLLEDKYKKIRHANIGSSYIKDKYQLDDDICNAVLYHTIGNKNMDTLAKIIYISDKIGRKDLNKDLEKVKELSIKSLDKAIIFFVTKQETILQKEGKKQHLDTIKLLNKLRNN